MPGDVPRGYAFSSITSLTCTLFDPGHKMCIRDRSRGEARGEANRDKSEGESETKRTYEPSPKHNPQGGWGSENPIPNDEVGQELLDSAY